MKIFSFDAETNGLWGQAFAIGAAVHEDGLLTHSFTAYLGPDGVADEWVRENVLPNLVGLPKTHESYGEMLKAFAVFYLGHRAGAEVIVHMGVPVEARILDDMHAHGFIGDFEGPYPLIDVAGVLKARGYDPTSVDDYAAKFRLLETAPEAAGMAPHHPLYDSIVTAKVYSHLLAA